MRTKTNMFENVGLEELLLNYFSYKQGAAPQAMSLTQPQSALSSWPMPFEALDEAAAAPVNALPPIMPEDGFGGGVLPEEDLDFLKLLYGELAKRLTPAVETVLARYETSGGAIFDELMDRESLALVVDEIIEEAQNYADEVANIAMDMERGHWGRYKLLRALAEALALQQILLRRKRYAHRNRNMTDWL